MPFYTSNNPGTSEQLDEKIRIVNHTHPYNLVLKDSITNNTFDFYLSENMVDELYCFLKEYNKQIDKITQLPYVITQQMLANIQLDELKESMNYNQNILFKDFLIVSNAQINKCISQNHEIKKIQVRAPISYNFSKTEITEFKAYYCKNCNLYFLSEEEYSNISKKGVLLCQHMTWAEYLDYIKHLQNKYAGLNEKSLIRRMGYSVNQQDNLSSYQRKSILAYIIETCPTDEKGTTWDKDTIIWFLREQIKSHPHHTRAIDKWIEDLNFLGDYNSNNEIVYGIRRILH